MQTSKSALLALPESTRALFERIRNARGIKNFILVGGTALALRLQHRLSEDLDFMTTGKMDRNVIAKILNSLHGSGCKKFTKIDDVQKALEFSAEGGDVENYSQNWRVDGVKLSFFSKLIQPKAAQHALCSILESESVPGVDCGLIRVATESCIFSLKSQVVSERLTSRDLFDLKVLIETGRYSFSDLLSEARKLGANPELVKERIAVGKLRLNDPPVNTISGETPDIETVRNWFVEQINEFERQLAKDAKTPLQLNRKTGRPPRHR